MYIENITKEWLTEQGQKLLSKDKNEQHLQSWWRGFEVAIKLAKKVENSAGICEQCGKLITNFSDYTQDSEGTVFCAKCFEKVFSKNG